MFKCHICGATKSKTELLAEIFQVNGSFYRVEDIPATVCKSCGEETFGRETTESIREMLHGPTIENMTFRHHCQIMIGK